MKVEITRTGEGSRVLNDDGSEINGVTRITVRAEAGRLTTAEVELVFIETTLFECDVREFYVGGYSNVVGLVLANGETVNLCEERYGQTQAT